jgi:hypothetical protein
VTTPKVSKGVVATSLMVLLAVGLSQWSQRRNDPAAEPGVQIAVVLLLEADARIAAVAATTPGERAERAALVRRTWDDAAQQSRLVQAERGEADGAGPGEEIRFVLTRWQDVAASPHRARVELVGHYTYRRGAGSWREAPDRVWHLRLSRLDPVGRTRGWRLVSFG